MRIAAVGFVVAALASSVVGQTTAPSTRLTLVTLQSKGGLPQSALRRLAEQSGVDIRMGDEDFWRHAENRPITIDVKDQPFWDVLLQVCEQAKIGPENFGQPDGLTLGQSDVPYTSRQPRSYRDGFLFIAESATRTHALTYGQKAGSNSFFVQLHVFVDPKIHVLQVPSEPNVTEATDDAGHSLAIKRQFDANEQLSDSSGDSFAQWQFAVPLGYQPNQGKMLKRLAGTAAFVVVDRDTTWELDVTKFEKTKREFPHATYSIESFEADNDTCTVKITIDSKLKPRDDGEESPLISGSSVTSMIKLFDAKGRPFTPELREENADGQKSSLSFTFDRNMHDRKVGKATTMVLTIPLSTKKLNVPFELKDLAIP